MAETKEDEDPTIYLGTFIEICSRHGLFDKHKRATAPYRRVTEEALDLLNWPNFDGTLQWSSPRKEREKYHASYVKMYKLYRNKYRSAKDEEKAALLEEWNGQPFISTALYETLFGKPKREKGNLSKLQSRKNLKTKRWLELQVFLNQPKPLLKCQNL